MSAPDDPEAHRRGGWLLLPPLAEDRSLREALTRLSLLGQAALPGCVAASITLIERDAAVTVGASSDLALELDAVQYEARDGPCLMAALEQCTVIVEDASTDDRWPAFLRGSDRAGIGSAAFVPLLVSDVDLAGGFNFYGTDPESFTGEDVSMSKSFAGQASAVVNARSFCAAAELFRHVAVELERRSVIEGAKGVLIGTSGHTPEQALEELRKRSERDNCGVHDVAASIVRSS